MTSDRNRLVFHGTRAPAGTSSKTLYPPSLNHPFFVADNPRIAESYVNTYSGSIFVLRLKTPPKKVAFDFRNSSHMKSLSGKIPNTVNFISDFLGHQRANTFFGASRMLDLAITVIDKDDPDYDPKAEAVKNASKYYKPEWLSLDELGLIRNVGDGTFDIDDSMKNLGGYGTTRRRAIKAKIYEKIKDLGFSIVMDGDTSKGSGINFSGNEFAMFDLDLIEDGINESIEVNKVIHTVKYLYPKEGL